MNFQDFESEQASERASEASEYDASTNDYDYDLAEHLNEESIKESCNYCGIHSNQSIVKCLTCSKWFCNSRNKGSNASHILSHLVKARHKEISLHPTGPLGIICPLI